MSRFFNRMDIYLQPKDPIWLAAFEKEIKDLSIEERREYLILSLASVHNEKDIIPVALLLQSDLSPNFYLEITEHANQAVRQHIHLLLFVIKNYTAREQQGQLSSRDIIPLTLFLLLRKGVKRSDPALRIRTGPIPSTATLTVDQYLTSARYEEALGIMDLYESPPTEMSTQWWHQTSLLLNRPPDSERSSWTLPVVLKTRATNFIPLAKVEDDPLHLVVLYLSWDAFVYFTQHGYRPSYPLLAELLLWRRELDRRGITGAAREILDRMARDWSKYFDRDLMMLYQPDQFQGGAVRESPKSLARLQYLLSQFGYSLSNFSTEQASNLLHRLGKHQHRISSASREVAHKMMAELVMADLSGSLDLVTAQDGPLERFLAIFNDLHGK